MYVFITIGYGELPKTVNIFMPLNLVTAQTSIRFRDWVTTAGTAVSVHRADLPEYAAIAPLSLLLNKTLFITCTVTHQRISPFPSKQ